MYVYLIVYIHLIHPAVAKLRIHCKCNRKFIFTYGTQIQPPGSGPPTWMICVVVLVRAYLAPLKICILVLVRASLVPLKVYILVW